MRGITCAMYLINRFYIEQIASILEQQIVIDPCEFGITGRNTENAKASYWRDFHCLHNCISCM